MLLLPPSSAPLCLCNGMLARPRRGCWREREREREGAREGEGEEGEREGEGEEAAFSFGKDKAFSQRLLFLSGLTAAFTTFRAGVKLLLSQAGNET